MLIDEVLPEWHEREQHRRRTDADPNDLLRSAEQLTWEEVAGFRTLMRIRAGGRRMNGATIIDGMRRTGFVELAAGPREIVFGAIGRPWTPNGGLIPLEAAKRATSFVDFDRPGFAKMALNFSANDGELSTETRVYLTDGWARMAFRTYWVVVRPFSGWIRREWLAGIVRRAGSGVDGDR